jgi:TolB protein
MKKLVNLLCTLLFVYTLSLPASTTVFTSHLQLETHAHVVSTVNHPTPSSAPTLIPPFSPLSPIPTDTPMPMPTPSPIPLSPPEILKPAMPAQIPTLPSMIVSTLPVGTEFPITTFEAHQQNPIISDGIVVWWDGRNDPNPYGNTYNDDIYGYNINTQFEFPIRVIPADQEIPAISGSIVVWQDWRHFGQYDIYGYNLGTQTEFPVSTAPNDQLSPAISGNFVVWTDTRNGWFDSGCSCWRNADIYGYDLNMRTEFAVCTAPGDQTSPAISGSIVVWQDNRNGNWDIYGYDLNARTEFAVRTTPGDQKDPDISGNIVVWEENGDIYGYYLSSQYVFPVSQASGTQWFPAISDYTIVWEDIRDGDPDIYGYDLINQEEFAVSTASGDQRFPAIWKDVIVWQDNRNGNWDIYGYLRAGWGGPSRIPVVLIHGRSGPADIGKADSVEDDNQLRWIYQWLREDGYKPAEIFYAQGISRYKSIFENAQALERVINEAKEATGAAKVDIIAHSMGGINARAYTEVIMRQPDVNRVFMLGR